MHIWVDADACPKPIKEILFRAAERNAIATTLVANHGIPLPSSPHIQLLVVSAGFDEADKAIVQQVAPGDLVITSDIPLADEVISKGGQALSPRGERFTTEDIRARLNIRDFLDTLRGSGIQTGGPAALSQADRQAFANELDRILARRTR